MKRTIFSAMAALALLPADARPVMPPLFTSNMVLQQQTSAPIWGTAKPGKKVTVTPSWDNQPVAAVADAQGNWRATLATPAAGGPYTLTVSDGQKVTLENVMVGEVWLCSGQSNMEMPIDGWTHVNNVEQEKQEANRYADIRLLQVRKNTSPQPIGELETNLGGGWQVCSAESVKEFSAVGYFFGRNLHQRLNVPIGLIDASWGGTFIEPWMSGEALQTHPDMVEQLDYVRSLPASKDDRVKLYNKRVEQWKAEETARDPGYRDGVALWAQTSLDDAAWPAMQVPVQWEQAGLPGYDGVVWLRFHLDIPASWAGRELKLSLGRVDDMDYTFFNGEEIGQTNDFGISRLYTVPARLVKAGPGVVTVRVIDTGGEGGIYSPADELYVECRGERLPLAGQWRYRPSVALKDMLQAPVNDTSTPNMVSLLYNAMINPLVPFAMQGAIWYQGENNEHKGYQYRELLPLLIRDWRQKWGRTFPFYIVQLANYKALQTTPEDSEWAEVREAQALAARHVENSGLACTIDLGEAGDIHPKNKQDVGLRLALVARAKTYGEQVACSGPVYRDYQIEGQQIRIFLDHAEGLTTHPGGQAVKGFAIAGADHQFHWAEATIDGQTVVVSAKDVPNPVAVRYAWAQNPLCNLYNGAGLPTVPFRTDDWPGLSHGNHRAN